MKPVLRTSSAARRARAGVGTLELVLCLPVLMFMVIAVFQVGHALVLRQRATVATRHAAWRDAVKGGTGDEKAFEDWITASRIRIETRSASKDIFGRASKMVPLDFSTTVTMTSDFEPPFDLSFGQPRIGTESTLFKDYWYTEADNEGLHGFLKKVAGGVASSIKDVLGG